MRLVVVKKAKTSKFVLGSGIKKPAAYSKDVKDMTDEERTQVLKYLESLPVRKTLSLRKPT